MVLSDISSLMVDIACSHIGVKEGKHASMINEYLSATTIGPGDHPWCAAFISWCMREALRINKKHGLNIEEWRCKSARVFDWEKWAKNRNLQLIYDCKDLAHRGDIIIYDFSHIGIVGFNQENPSQKIITIEGNTNKNGSRNGDGVYLKKRTPSPEIIHCLIRM